MAMSQSSGSIRSRWRTLGVWQDVRYALRLFRRSPSFVAVAVLSLALGTGATSALFSLLNSLMWRELPLRDPGQLVRIGARTAENEPRGLSFPIYAELARRQQAFSAMFAWWGDGILNVEAGDLHTRADIWAVSGNFHDELGVAPLAGRWLQPSDVRLDTMQPARVAVIGHSFWQRHLGSDPQAIGQTVRVEGEPFTIVGIGPAGFTALGLVSEPDVTVPLTAMPLLVRGRLTFSSSESLWLDVGGRLRGGVTLEQARAQLAAIWPDIRAATLPPGWTGAQRDGFLANRLEVASIARGQDYFLRTRFTRPLGIVLGVAALVLLIACVNLASLMLSRMSLRTSEMALRGALGAGRARLVRQIVTEGVILALAGGALGLVFAWWSSAALSALMTADYLVPSRLTVTPDWRVLAFSVSLATLAGLLVSIAPAWRATRRDLTPTAQGSRTAPGVGRVSRGLVIAQTALSVVILMDAGLLVRTLTHLRGVDPGMRVDDIVVAQLSPRPQGYAHLVNETYYPQLLAAIAALPDVQAVGWSRVRLGRGDKWSEPVRPSGAPSRVTASIANVSPGLLDTIGVRLLAGRDFQWTDTAESPKVAIVSEALAQRLFPGGAIGRRIDVGAAPKGQGLVIVGVAANARLYDVRDPNLLAVYAPGLQQQARNGALLVRTARPAAVAGALRKAVDSLGHEYVMDVRSLAQGADRALLQERVTAYLATFFGGLALLLALIGLCGMMLYTVAQRTREIGVRVAIGAERHDVLRLILKETLTLVGVGVLLGAPLALAASRLVASLLHGMTPSDPLTLALVIAALLLVGLAAGAIPAYRASRIDPMKALRS